MSCVKPVSVRLALALLAAVGCSSSEVAGPPAPSDALPALRAVTDGVEPGRIVDSTGREVLLRGVNVNAHVEYWQYDPELFTTYPFTEEDADMVAAMGWNMVRLLLSWSRVEPNPCGMRWSTRPVAPVPKVSSRPWAVTGCVTTNRWWK